MDSNGKDEISHWRGEGLLLLLFRNLHTLQLLLCFPYVAGTKLRSFSNKFFPADSVGIDFVVLLEYLQSFFTLWVKDSGAAGVKKVGRHKHVRPVHRTGKLVRVVPALRHRKV